MYTKVSDSVNESSETSPVAMHWPLPESESRVSDFLTLSDQVEVCQTLTD